MGIERIIDYFEKGLITRESAGWLALGEGYSLTVRDEPGYTIVEAFKI